MNVTVKAFCEPTNTNPEKLHTFLIRIIEGKHVLECAKVAGMGVWIGECELKDVEIIQQHQQDAADSLVCAMTRASLAYAFQCENDVDSVFACIDRFLSSV